MLIDENMEILSEHKTISELDLLGIKQNKNII